MKQLNPKSEVYRGYSLIEILVVITVFALLSVVASQALLLTLRGARKSEATIKVRENVSFALAVIGRHLHNSLAVTPCPNLDASRLDYSDQDGGQGSFTCVDPGEEGYLASGSARLTTDKVAITECLLTCNPGTLGSPPWVEVTLTAKSSETVGAEGSSVTTSTQIFLRNF